jgi:hypothetical protein
VTSRTEFVQQADGCAQDEVEGRKERVTFDCIAGLQEQIAMLRSLCVHPLMAVKQGSSPGTTNLSNDLFYASLHSGHRLIIVFINFDGLIG